MNNSIYDEFCSLISIIIPIYNSELFLRRCIESLLAQASQEFELIMVDDKSEDKSLEIVKKYKDKFKHIKIISLSENKGVSNARNIGIQHAKGEYIFFLDSDDFVAPNFLESMHKNIKKFHSDIICFSYYYVSRKNRISKNIFNHKKGKYTCKDIIRFLLMDTSLHFFVWNKLFKRDIILSNQVVFERRCFEDMLFTLKMFYFSNNVLITNEFLYYYQKHHSSLTDKMSFEKLYSYLDSLKFIKIFLMEQDVYEFYKLNYIYLVLRFLMSCIYRIPEALVIKTPRNNFIGEIRYIFSNIKGLMFDR